MALKRLETSKDYQVADDSADIRGWNIVDGSGTQVGKIEGLLFEPADNRVHYAIAEIDNRCVTLPVSDLDIDEGSRKVTARGYDRTRLTGLRQYDESSWTEDTERAHYKEHVIGHQDTDRIDYGHERFRGNMPQRLRLLEEHLNIGKHREKIGEATLSKRPVTETVTEDVKLMNESVDIERRNVNEPARAGETFAAKSETISVPLYGERADVSKETFVREEVGLNKQQHERTETVRGEVQHDELVTEGMENTRERELTFSGTEPTEAELAERRRLEAKRDLDVYPENRDKGF